MIIYSLMQKQYWLEVVEVEIELIRGLPEIKILGLPDQNIRESIERIKSALSSQGFSLPISQQVIVNLRPSHIKKISRGLDLAIAVGILSLTGQIQLTPESLQGKHLYGELYLNGKVKTPDDLLENLPFLNLNEIVTGKVNQTLTIKHLPLEQLRDIDRALWQQAGLTTQLLRRPKVQDIKFTSAQARLLKVCALGEHSLLLAGPSGTGKTTFVEAVNPLLDELSVEDWRECKRMAKYFSSNEELWRAQVSPHHSATSIAFLGGGVPPKPGDITRAHGGVLILDELLEFDDKVQSALREPIEKGFIHLSRGSQSQIFPANFLLLSTTNLCPCGGFSPQKISRCRCSSMKLRKYLEKLSGPFLDRFQMFSLTDGWLKRQEKTESTKSILEEMEQVRQWTKSSGRHSRDNHKRSVLDLLKDFESAKLVQLIPQTVSERRRLAIVRVARTIADLEQSEKILTKHLRESIEYTFQNYCSLQQVIV